MANDRSKVVNSDRSCEEMVEEVRRLYQEHSYVTFTWMEGQQRTLTQNRALHLWLQLLARDLNDAGLDMRAVLNPEFEISWTKDSAKEYLFRPVYQAMTQKESTVDADRIEYSQVAEEIGRHLQQKLGITPPPWPKKKGEDK